MSVSVLIHGIREAVLLEEVDVIQRPAIIQAYMKIAPGARPHITVDKDAQHEEFAWVAPKVPVYKVNRRE